VTNSSRAIPSATVTSTCIHAWLADTAKKALTRPRSSSSAARQCRPPSTVVDDLTVPPAVLTTHHVRRDANDTSG
jgi:hypothetical protein